MKKLFAIVLIAVMVLLSACNTNSRGSEPEYDEEIIQLEAHYEYLIDEYRAEAEQYRDEIAYYEEVIHYYENLCDMYGYHTYEGIYYPELWCNYLSADTKIYHNDWLCPEFDKNGSYFSTANAEFYEEYEGYTQCKVCGGTKICFLDVEDGVIHSQKSHLDLGTEDYITRDVNYRFVSEENAIENGFIYCEDCSFD
jgi:hypothetical protein